MSLIYQNLPTLLIQKKTRLFTPQEREWGELVWGIGNPDLGDLGQQYKASPIKLIAEWIGNPEETNRSSIMLEILRDSQKLAAQLRSRPKHPSGLQYHELTLDVPTEGRITIPNDELTNLNTTDEPYQLLMTTGNFLAEQANHPKLGFQFLRH